MRGIHFVAVCLWAVSVVAEIKIASKKIQGTNKSHAKSSPISKNSTLGAGGHKKNPKDQHSLGKVNTRSLFGRQECEPGFGMGYPFWQVPFSFLLTMAVQSCARSYSVA